MRFLKIEFIAIVLGIMAGIGFAVLSRSRWDFVGKVPEASMQISSVYPFYVQTTNGHNYLCDSVSKSCPQVESYDVPKQLCPSFSVPNAQTPFYPGTVVISFAQRICGAHWSSDTYVIALDDGTIWTWTNGMFDGIFKTLIVILSTFCGAVLGIPVCLVVWWRSRRYEKAKRKNA